MQRGSKMITIDPALTWLAARSEVWLRVRPGTDAALAMAMANVLIEEDLYDHDFVERWTYGFEEFAEVVKEWTPEKAAEVCWVDAEDIVKAARMYGAAANAAIQWGLKIDQTSNATSTADAVNALWAITGNVDNPGGNIIIRNAYDQNLIVLGDFNIEKRGDFLDKTFLSEGLYVPEELQMLSRSIFDESKYYDQIAWFNTADKKRPKLSLEFMGAGNYDFVNTAMVNRGLTKQKLSYMISDHYPLWANFRL